MSGWWFCGSGAVTLQVADLFIFFFSFPCGPVITEKQHIFVDQSNFVQFIFLGGMGRKRFKVNVIV